MQQRVQKRSAAGAMVCMSLLAAMSIICGKYLAFGVGNVLRFSLENLPILLSGMVFGPVAGMLTGVVADLVGCFLVGYAINPLVTLGAAAVGGVSGVVYWALSKNQKIPQGACICLSAAAAHLLGSVIIKTVGLVMFYPMPLYLLMLWRLLNYAIIGTLDALILYVLMKNKAVKGVFVKVSKRG